MALQVERGTIFYVDVTIENTSQSSGTAYVQVHLFDATGNMYVTQNINSDLNPNGVYALVPGQSQMQSYAFIFQNSAPSAPLGSYGIHVIATDGFDMTGNVLAELTEQDQVNYIEVTPPPAPFAVNIVSVIERT